MSTKNDEKKTRFLREERLQRLPSLDENLQKHHWRPLQYILISAIQMKNQHSNPTRKMLYHIFKVTIWHRNNLSRKISKKNQPTKLGTKNLWKKKQCFIIFKTTKLYIHLINFTHYYKQTHPQAHTYIIPLKTTSKVEQPERRFFAKKRKRTSNEKNLKEAFSHTFLFSLLYLRRAGREDAQLGVSKPVSPLIKGSTTITKCERRGKPASPCSWSGRKFFKQNRLCVFSRQVARFLMAQSDRRKTIFFQKSSGKDHHVILASLEPFSKKKTYSVKSVLKVQNR